MINGVHDTDYIKDAAVQPLYALAKPPKTILWTEGGAHVLFREGSLDYVGLVARKLKIGNDQTMIGCLRSPRDHRIAQRHLGVQITEAKQSLGLSWSSFMKRCLLMLPAAGTSWIRSLNVVGAGG